MKRRNADRKKGRKEQWNTREYERFSQRALRGKNETLQGFLKGPPCEYHPGKKQGQVHFFFIRDSFFEISLGVFDFSAVVSLKFS